MEDKKMEDKKSEQLFRKAMKDFPDYQNVVRGSYPVKASQETSLENIDILSKTPILPFQKLTDVIGKSATDSGSVLVDSYNNFVNRSEKPLPTYHVLASDIRDIYTSKIGEEIEKRNIDPYSEIPLKTGHLQSFSEKEQEDPTIGGYYKPITGNIHMRSGLSPEEYLGTYAHEAGHKISDQSLGTEGDKPISLEQSILKKDLMNIDILKPLLLKAIDKNRVSKDKAIDIFNTLYNTEFLGPTDPAAIVDKYYSTHHRSDSPTSWEIQALRNLDTKGILNTPYTPEARPENIPVTGYKQKYYELIKKKSK